MSASLAAEDNFCPFESTQDTTTNYRSPCIVRLHDLECLASLAARRADRGSRVRGWWTEILELRLELLEEAVRLAESADENESVDGLVLRLEAVDLALDQADCTCDDGFEDGPHLSRCHREEAFFYSRSLAVVDWEGDREFDAHVVGVEVALHVLFEVLQGGLPGTGLAVAERVENSCANDGANEVFEADVEDGGSTAIAVAWDSDQYADCKMTIRTSLPSADSTILSGVTCLISKAMMSTVPPPASHTM